MGLVAEVHYVIPEEARCWVQRGNVGRLRADRNASALVLLVVGVRVDVGIAQHLLGLLVWI